MFGLFKKSIPPAEFGLVVLKYADSFLTNDGCRSLAERFQSYDASKGWVPVFESNGLPLAQAKLYLRFFSHAALQAVFKTYPLAQRRAMVLGAISGLADTPPGYEVTSVFEELESAFDGRRQFSSRVAALQGSLRLEQLALPTAHIVVAKYLIERVILPGMKNGDAFISQFESFSQTVGVGLSVTHRAMNSLLSQVKLS